MTDNDKLQYTDFGQIEIYNSYFPADDFTDLIPLHSPDECLKENCSYSVYNREMKSVVPIMIGSDIHKKFHEKSNPLGIYGYFIINGKCKYINNMYLKLPSIHTKDRCYIEQLNGRFNIEQMGHYTITIKGNTSKFYLPINYKNIFRYSANREKLEAHLSLAIRSQATYSPQLLFERDLMKLAYTFDAWLGLRPVPKPQWRLITAGEIIRDAITFKDDIINCFNTNTWTVKNIKFVNSVSEDMDLFNSIYNIESIRRVTYPVSRENMLLSQRLVQDDHEYKLCPAQTSEGSLCGTVLYLCVDARVTSKEYIPMPSLTNPTTDSAKRNRLALENAYLYENNEYKGVYPIKQCKDFPNCIVVGNVAYTYTNAGNVMNGSKNVSYTVSKIPYYKHNPPVRSLFSSNMMKQAISYDTYISSYPINDCKQLVNTPEQPLSGPNLPSLIGFNLNTAIMLYYGYNIEDALVVSESTAEKFASNKFMIYRFGKESEASIPSQSSLYKTIEVKVDVKDKVKKGDILFTEFYPSNVQTIVHTTSKMDGYVYEINEKFIKICRESKLNVGDKLTNRHGQKGIVSLIVKDNKMPKFLCKKTGKWIPLDIIMNPHAIPSRMTYGQIKEMGDQYTDVEINDNKLVSILVGPVYYIALRHQVLDKVQFRNVAELDSISKQATKGKIRHGGLRFGHMERDILIAQNAWKVLKNVYDIDEYRARVCKVCGKIDIIHKRIICKCQDYTPIEFNCHYYLILCVSYLRACGKDLRYFPEHNTYKLVPLDAIKTFPPLHTPYTKNLEFGQNDPFDIRRIDRLPILPLAVRTQVLNEKYKKIKIDATYINNTLKIIKSTLRAKNGIYHQCVEGHKVNHCIRSVIVPNPYLPIDTVEVPHSAKIGTKYALLNRQPSLNIHSIMGVNIKHSNKDSVIKINPLLCKAFNADFDGDEMALFGLTNKQSKNEARDKLPVVTAPTQDYILKDYLNIDSLETLTEKHKSFTADKESIMLMIKAGSKGKQFNYDHLFDKIGDAIVNGEKIMHITNCYSIGLNDKEWYALACGAREAAASIGVNTPFTGHLESLCNAMYI